MVEPGIYGDVIVTRRPVPDRWGLPPPGRAHILAPCRLLGTTELKIKRGRTVRYMIELDTDKDRAYRERVFRNFLIGAKDPDQGRPGEGI